MKSRLNAEKLEKLIAIIIASVIGLPVLTGSGLFLMRSIENRRTLQHVAAQLGTKSDWNEIRYAVYCDVLAPGRARLQAERDLEVMGGFAKYIDSETRNYYFSADSILPANLYATKQIPFLPSHLIVIEVVYNSDHIAKVSVVEQMGVYWRLDAGPYTYRKLVSCDELKSNLEQ